MKQSEKKQNVTVKILERNQGAPAHLLGRAEIHFHTGLMAGLRITGLALWAANGAKGRFVSVTFPNQQVDKADGTAYFDYIRGSKGEDVKRLKGAVVNAYREYARANDLDVPEDTEAA